MAQRDIYAFDCGTTNWRLYRLSCEESEEADGRLKVKALSSPECVALTTFAGRHLPAAILLDDEGRVQSYGKNAYGLARDVELRPLFRDAFKLCIGNHEAVEPLNPHRRYTHQEAITYTRLLLEQVVARLGAEKPGSLTGETYFFFAHPVHWGKEEADGVIEGDILPDFAAMVRSCFPADVPIYFVPEPEGALMSLQELGQLKTIPQMTLVIDVGGGTTDFVRGRWTAAGLQDVRHYGEAHGSGLFDHDLAAYLADLLRVPEAHQDLIWPELCERGRELKERLSQQMRMDSTQPVAMRIIVEIPGEVDADDSTYLSRRLRFRQEDFEKQTEKTANAFERLVLRALWEMGLRQQDVGQVVLVGGGANLYLVPQLIEGLFGEAIPVLYGNPPEETIARGTVLWHTRPRIPAPKAELPEVTVAPHGSQDYPTLEQAIAMVAEGGTINLLAGEHRLTEPLLLKKSVRLVGDEMDTTTVVGDSQEYVLKFAGSGQFEAERITFRYEGATWADVVVVTDGEVRLASCRFSGGQDKDGVHGGNGLLLSGTVRGQVYQCRAEGNQGCGILVDQQAQPRLEGNSCQGNKQSGIRYIGRASGGARKNQCAGNGMNGIGVRQQAQPTLEANSCQGNKYNGILYVSSASGMARKNQCVDNGGSGINVRKQAKPTLEQNTCQGNKRIGIVYFDSASGVARKNKCVGNKAHGIQVCQQAKPILEENTCQGNKQQGIQVSGSASGVARQNQCVGNENSGIQVSDQARPTLEGNTCQGNKQVGIVYFDWASGVARQNKCVGNEMNGIQVSDQAQPTLERNHCQENKVHGIIYTGTAKGEAQKNQCVSNEMSGIKVNEQAEPVLSENICRENKMGITVASTANPQLLNNHCSNNKKDNLVDYRKNSAVDSSDSDSDDLYSVSNILMGFH